MQTCVRCKIEDGLGDTAIVVDAPLELEIRSSGERGLHAAQTSLVSA